LPVRKVPDAPGATRLLLGDDGRVLARFVQGTREGRPWADLLELEDGVAVDEVVPVALRDLAGWLVAGPVELGRALVAAGGRRWRHAHVMRRELRPPPPPEWATGRHGDLRIVPVARPPADLAPAMLAAHPPGHLDFEPGDDELPRVVRRLEGIMGGQEVGELLGCSRLAVDAADRVVGAGLVCDAPSPPPFGGPWLAELFCDVRGHGVGAALLRHALAAAAGDGHAAIGLAVTEGNPARGLYEATGFEVVSSALSVYLPA
jgi:ribosomal protein S18 acetylase RimI-like enzyme